MPTSLDPLTFGAAFARTLRLSRYVERVAHAYPEVVAELEARGARPFTREEMRAFLAGDPQPMAPRLRRLSERVMVTLAHRDLNRAVPVGNTGKRSALPCMAPMSCPRERRHPPVIRLVELLAEDPR